MRFAWGCAWHPQVTRKPQVGNADALLAPAEVTSAPRTARKDAKTDAIVQRVAAGLVQVMDLREFAVEEFALTECVQRKTRFNQLRDDGSMERMPQHHADPTPRREVVRW